MVNVFLVIADSHVGLKGFLQFIKITFSQFFKDLKQSLKAFFVQIRNYAILAETFGKFMLNR